MNEFGKNLVNIFDIAHQNTNMTIIEEQEFLISQKKSDRLGSIR